MKIYDSLTELIGRTPLVRMHNIEQAVGADARILAKVEYFNPGGSVKDRIAFSMIKDAEDKGILRPGGTIIEPTSGNTGIGLAWVGKARGYNVVLTMPDTMSIERRNLLKAYGADLVLTPGGEGMKGAIAKAEELRDATAGAVILGQFDNPANPSAHEHSTGVEIYADTDGAVDIFVAGVGTGGTVSGVGRTLKELKPSVEVVAVEPSDSAVLSGGKPGPHKIQGLGAGFIPGNYDAEVVDRVVQVTAEEATEGARMMVDLEGLLCGISSGAAMYAAIKMATDPVNKGKTIVALLPDTGERYLSTPLFDRSKE